MRSFSEDGTTTKTRRSVQRTKCVCGRPDLRRLTASHRNPRNKITCADLARQEITHCACGGVTFGTRRKTVFAAAVVVISDHLSAGIDTGEYGLGGTLRGDRGVGALIVNETE